MLMSIEDFTEAAPNSGDVLKLDTDDLLAVMVQMRLKINQFLYPIGKDVKK